MRVRRNTRLYIATSSHCHGHLSSRKVRAHGRQLLPIREWQRLVSFRRFKAWGGHGMIERGCRV